MRNQQIYYVNRQPPIRVIQQPYIVPNAYNQSNYYAPYSSQFQQMPQQRHIESVDGIQVLQEYCAEAGDPIIIEQVIFKGEVVQVGQKEKQVIHENEAIIVSDGYASQDGRLWKPLHKIMLTPFKIRQLSIENIDKVKAKFDNSLPNHKIMKITCAKTDYFLGFKYNVFNEWFVRLIWAKLMIDKRQVEQYGDWGNSISGNIFKKSEILGSWEPRFVQINAVSLLSSKNQLSESASMEIKDTKAVWTRFEQIEGGFYLVVKLWYGIIKEQFAVPFKHCLKWLYHFLNLLKLN